MEEQWASERGRLLQIAKGSPRDWLRAWELGQQQNPFAPPPKSTLDRAKEIEADVARRAPLAQAYKKALGLDDSVVGADQESLTSEDRERMQTVVAVFDRKKAIADVKREEVKLEHAATIADKERSNAPTPTGPPTPAWLAGMFPNQATAGQPLTKFSAATPSAQWWNQAPESQRQAFLGFVDWTGGTPTDLLGNIRQQLPQPRRVPTSRPARQRTSV